MTSVLEGRTANIDCGASTDLVKVVVVDDQQSFRDAAAAVVEASDGFVLVAALAGAAGLEEVLRLHRPEVLLLDVRMPDADGAQIAQRVVADHPSVVVVLMSVYSVGEIPAGVVGGRILFVEKENLDAVALARARQALGRGGAEQA